MRKAVALALSLAVQAAALGAPLVHTHPDEHATAHHAGRSMHVHWSGHGQPHHHDDHTDGPAFGIADEDRAVFVNVFVAVPVPLFSVPSPAPAVFTLAVPAERASERGLDVVRSHDPPSLHSLPSRAPPSFLS